MRASLSAAIIAATVLSCSVAWSGCPPRKSRNCVNLDIVPQISQQVVGPAHLAPPPVARPATVPKAPYTGPTVGLAPTVRRTPTVGYRWAIN
jgi:hypothetical protein